MFLLNNEKIDYAEFMEWQVTIKLKNWVIIISTEGEYFVTYDSENWNLTKEEWEKFIGFVKEIIQSWEDINIDRNIRLMDVDKSSQ